MAPRAHQVTALSSWEHIHGARACFFRQCSKASIACEHLLPTLLYAVINDSLDSLAVLSPSLILRFSAQATRGGLLLARPHHQLQLHTSCDSTSDASELERDFFFFF